MRLTYALQEALEVCYTECRNETTDSYRSYIKILTQYLHSKKWEYLEPEEFTRKHAKMYLVHIKRERKISNTTRNNHLIGLKAVFSRLVELEHMETNPFSKIKKLKPEVKRKKVYTKEERSLICNYLREENPHFLLLVLICYYCGFRPKEIRRMKVGDIDLQRGILSLDGTDTKNGELAQVAISPPLIEYCYKININQYPKSHYLLSHGPQIGPDEVGKNYLRLKYRQLMVTLQDLGFIKEIEGLSFYSWKDCLAIDLIEEGATILEVKQHLRHKSIDTTHRYMSKAKPKMRVITERKTRLF